MPLFAPPNVEELKAKRDVLGLIKPLEYQQDWRVRTSAAEAAASRTHPQVPSTHSLPR